MFSYVVSSYLLFVPVLLIVAFLTLMERNVLGLVQARNGPNKVSAFGIFQPIADALNLLGNESSLPTPSNPLLFVFAPVFGLTLILILWEFHNINESPLSLSFSVLWILVLMSIGVYPLLLAGWASNSKFALWGSSRSVAQTVAYEISLSVVFMTYFLMANSFSLNDISSMNLSLSFISLSLPLVLSWFILCIAETNRAPFDFAESESELVSGFNTEFSASLFTLMFLAEYASILFLAEITCLFSYTPHLSSLTSVIILSLVSGLWLWIRATYPRFRFDLLINYAWKAILPFTLSLLLVGVCLT